MKLNMSYYFLPDPQTTTKTIELPETVFFLLTNLAILERNLYYTSKFEMKKNRLILTQTSLSTFLVFPFFLSLANIILFHYQIALN